MNIHSQSVLKKLLPMFLPYRKQILMGGIFMIVYVSCWPLLALLAGKLIPAIGEGDLSKVAKTITLALFVFFIQKIAQFFQDVLLANPSLSISQELRNTLFKNLQRIELSGFEKLSTGDITYRLTEDADRVGEVIYKTIQDSIPSALQLIAVFMYMIYLDIQLSIATILLAPLVTLLVSNFGSKVLKAAERSQQKVSDLAALLSEAVQGVPIVRAFAVESWIEKRFNKEVVEHKKARYRTLRLLALQHPIVGFIEAAGILTILAIGTLRINSGYLNAEGFSSYIAAVLMLIDPISHLTTNFNEFKQGEASLRRLYEIDAMPKEQQDATNAQKLINPKGEIKFKNLIFEYEKDLNVLNNFNLTIKSGTNVALVGASGAGKSTIFALLLRFYRPKSGEILFDGVNISSIKSSELRNKIALVPQTISVFSGTIAEAIIFGRQINDNNLYLAAKTANAHEFIMNLANGYQTKIEERGSNLSGGQLQRIIIARAIYGNPSVMLLDEATSALDADAEEAVQIGIKQAMKGRTVFIIAHKLSTVQEADLIVLIENGKIIEQGKHEELVKTKGKYRDLCEKQFLRQT